jgi:chromosome segregation protein
VFLKSLTLKGFKSFAEATTLTFEPGVTVVVGPNGSGKSNIVDAVAWVLGAQGPRTVRSQKMEDVIFAGNASRPALGRAEVSLTIDNSAGLLPIEFTEVTITRTLFRSSGESEYAINGVPCRLLDIQELLSDSGVGRTQHVIVSQGNLDAILNARPEERRLVIEEAAGVLKYRRRKEKAERRLEATEANLVRLTDLLREVRRQLRPLQRQAEAARRHAELAAELRALRLHLAGRELAVLNERAGANAAARSALTRAEADLRARLARLDAAVAAAEAARTAIGTSGLAEVVARYESQRERARGLAALLAERRRSAERERAALLDTDVAATLEAEAERLRGELREVEAEALALAPRADALARAEEDLAAERAAEPDPDDAASAAAEAAAVRGELAALRLSLERARTEGSRLEGRLAALAEKAARLDAEEARLAAEVAEAAGAEPALVAAAADAAARRAAAEADVAAAEASWREAEAERSTWTARADALAMALDEVRARAGAERLAELDGVVGTLLDLVEVDPGWEAAFEAACGEAVAAVCVASPAVARAALAALKAQQATGAVLALGRDPGAGPGPELALLGERVRDHVRAVRPDVDALLDVLLAGAVAVRGGWEQALDLSLAHPGAVVVTLEGDRFGPAGWRVGTTAHGATGAALEEAVSRAEAAAAAAREAAARLAACREALAEAATAEAACRERAEACAARLARARDAEARLAAAREHLDGEADSLRAHLAGLRERQRREAARIAELEAALPALEAEEAAGAERVAAARAARARHEERAAALAALRRDLEVTAAALEQRRALLARRLAEVDERLAADRAAREQAAARLAAAALTGERLVALAAVVEGALARIDERLGVLRAARDREAEAARAATERLESLRRERAAVERELEEVRERMRRAELEEAELRLRLESAVEALRRDFDCEPEAALGAPCPPLPPGTAPDTRARELEREVRLLGPINPLALEEYQALEERHAFLEAQIDDVKASRRELTKLIRAVDDEIVTVFRAAFADVADNYERLFASLFPGGSGRLTLTDPANLLETGVEIEARPPGKTVRKLSLLSGGERSLTALAFLFAVFRSRPSPFYLLDEVEAALDDVNLHRFLALIDEFRDEAQLVIVSHQKRTMEAADCLYGVTMQPGGSTKVISERTGAPARGRVAAASGPASAG